MKNNIGQIIGNLIKKITQPQTYRFGNWDGVPTAKAQSPQVQQIVQQTQQPVPQVQGAQTGQITPEMIQKAIQIYGGKDAPIGKYADTIAQESNKYEFTQDNPYLIPAIAHLESSSGRNVTRPNNPLNWGINYPGNNEAFSKLDQGEVIKRAISGLAERSPYYQKFRTGQPLTDEQLMELAKTYEPANPDYGKNLINAIKFIQSQVK